MDRLSGLKIEIVPEITRAFTIFGDTLFITMRSYAGLKATLVAKEIEVAKALPYRKRRARQRQIARDYIWRGVVR